MTKEEIIQGLYRGDSRAIKEAIKALEIVEEFEKAQIITGGRLNGRTYAYKRGLEDGKRKALEQHTSEDCVSRTQAIEWIENLRQMDKCFGNYEDDYFPLSEVIDRLKNVPPVTPREWEFPKEFESEDK